MLVFCVAAHVTSTNIRNAQSCCERLASADVDQCTAMKSEWTIIVPLDFCHYLVRQAISCNLYCLSHLDLNHTHTHLGYRVVKHPATKFDQMNSGGTITRPPGMIIKMAATPTVLHNGQRETQFPPFKFLGSNPYIKGSTESSAPLNNAVHFNLLITWCTGESKKKIDIFPTADSLWS